METIHKHKGVERSDTGALRSHPVSQKHKDKTVQKYHNLSLTVAQKKTNISPKKIGYVAKKSNIDLNNLPKPNIVETKVVDESICCAIDNDGYATMNLDSITNIKGIRISFSRYEHGKKRICGLQIDNKPTSNLNRKKLVKNVEYC